MSDSNVVSRSIDHQRTVLKIWVEFDARLCHYVLDVIWWPEEVMPDHMHEVQEPDLPTTQISGLGFAPVGVSLSQFTRGTL